MQPTIKFRLLKSHGFIKGDPFLTDSYGNYYRVQQWWEGEKNKRLKLPGGGYSDSYDEGGQWRDIPIEVEE